MDFGQGLVNWFNDSNLILALAIIVGNVGAKYLGEEIDVQLDRTFNNYLCRKIIVFALVFSGTRNFQLSLLAVLIYALSIHCCRRL